MGIIRDTLNGIVDSDYAGLQQLYKVFHSVPGHELPIIRFSLFPGSSLIRQRINEQGRVFSHLSELSYPPPSLAPMARANLPGQPMFYACKFPNEISKDSPIPRKIALEETSSFIKDRSNTGIERATVSRWSIVEQLELIALPFIGTYPKACPELIQINSGWEDAIQKGDIPSNALELVYYMAEEISKDFDSPNGYFKIANFVNYLMTTCAKTKDSDGILFPSVPSRGEGFNVAVKPEVVNTKIRFSNATICYAFKRGTKMTILSMKDAIVDDYGNIVSYKDRDFGDNERAYYRDLSKGLDFVN